MRPLTCLFSSALLILISCTDKVDKSEEKLFTPANILVQQFSIDPAEDTTLIGLRGGIFKISKGSFEGNSPINIEIKEVYSPLEIMYAGLVTESNGLLLESGGMVYLNAFDKSNKQAALLKPIDISIPSNYINENMQLFKGEEQPDGNINWTDPQPLNSFSNTPCLEKGKAIFEGHCQSCHTIFKDWTGPALAGVEERVKDRRIIKEYIRFPAKMIYSNSYFMCLKKEFGSVMTAFPMLTDQDIDCLLDYVKNETAKRPDLKPAGPSKPIVPCIDAPCGFDTLYIDTTSAITAGINMLSLESDSVTNDEISLRDGFIDAINTKGQYNFSIETLGWFNIDAYMEPLEGTQKVDLFVKTDFPDNSALDVHVFFPARKLLTVGIYEKDGLFHFEKYEGQIPLFLNDQAIAFASTSIGEKLYYGITSFSVTQKQTVSLKIKEGNKRQLSQAFQDMKLDGIELDIITKKRIISPSPCTSGSDSDTTLNTTSSL